MNNSPFLKACFLIFSFSLITFACRTPEKDEYEQNIVDRVNVQIGAISHLLVPTYPTVHLPNSMVRIYPQTTPGINEPYLASRIFSFPVNIPSHRQRPFTTLMVTSNLESISPDSLASTYDHDFETATPYYYSVLLEDPAIWVENTVTAHGVIYRFRRESGGPIRIVLRTSGTGKFNADETGTITGYDQMRKVTQYLYASTDPKPVSTSYFSLLPFQITETPEEGQRSGIFLDYQSEGNETITLEIGISYVSGDMAQVHFQEELSGNPFEEIQADAKNTWEQALGRIRIQGGSPDEQTVFYTSLYRCYERMVNITEEGKYYSVYDGQVHQSEGADFYVDDWSWDTYRTLHPLRTILTPAKEADMISSYIRIFEQSGWMPSFPTLFGDMGAMIGHHPAAIISDAWFKGIRDFDVEKAYEGLKKNAMEGTRIPWREGPKTSLDEIYLEKGFFPGKYPDQPETQPEVHPFEGRQSVAVTLEHAYDDWNLGRLAGALGKKEDAEYFYQRGQNYRNLYNPKTGFMSPRDASGQWIEPFNPKTPAGIGGREYFAESNAWTYTWSVQQDLSGLFDLMGGKKIAVQRLDRLFDEPIGQSKWTYLGYMPDATGLTGMFPMGNEPGFHIPYVYDPAGAPWKTQKRVRQLMNAWFRNDLMGICGDDDGGAMSAWYVFSAMGFYPICPGYPVYVLGSPVFESVTIRLEDDNTFQIIAENVSERNKYIQSANLNGSSLNEPWFTHDELMKGGELILEMGPRPNKDWGSGVDFTDVVNISGKSD
jgi:predicted alpha-1,2-mannosidase